MTETADVVIAGAGIAGIATAHQLAVRHDVTDIVLVDPRPPLTLTSDKTGANYREWWPQRPMVELVRRSLDLMEAMVESDRAFRINRRGYLYVTTEAGAEGTLSHMVGRHEAAGIGPIRFHPPGRPSSYEPAAAEGMSGPDGADVIFDRSLIRETCPHFSPDVTGAVHARRAGNFDTTGLGHYLLELAIGRGTRVVRGEVTGIVIDGGVQAVVVTTAQGSRRRIATRRFVNAAGPFAARVAGFLGCTLPVANVLQQKISLPDPLGVVPRNAPFTILLDPQELDWTAGERERLLGSPGTRRLVERMPGGLHIKPDGSDENPLVKLGWAFRKDPEEPSWEPSRTPDFPGVVLRGAVRIIPGFAAYVASMPGPVVHKAGYYVKTPDELPLIGPHEIEGTYVVGGLAGFGGMVACATGEIAAAWVAGADRPPWASAFVPERFTSPAYVPAVTQGGETGGAL